MLQQDTVSTRVAPSAPPCGIDPADLRRITRDYAARPERWAPRVRYAMGEHWSLRIHADDDLDIWLNTWLREQSTTLHDHGRSAGAFTVVSGRLREFFVSGQEIGVPAGESRSFGAGYVHDVYNPHPEPAFSIHAYSPPLTEMSYYSIATGGGLEIVRTLDTDVPIN